jgi:hypothetical protein
LLTSLLEVLYKAACLLSITTDIIVDRKGLLWELP